MNIDWNYQLNEAIQWCNSNCWSIVYCQKKDEELADPETSTIFISRRRKLEHRFYILLHEIGHTRLFLRPNYEEYFQRYNNQKKHSTLAYKVLMVEEEVLAWHEGERLAVKQGWSLGPSYQFLKAKQLASYMNWVVVRQTTKEIKEKILPFIDDEEN